MVVVMRRIVLLSPLLFLAACSGTPAPEEAPAPPPAANSPNVVHSNLIGASAAQLIQLFGQPALQVREGPGLKLQWRGRSCILDAYLYAQGAAGERVAHVDTRVQSGADTDQLTCVGSLSRL